MFQVQSVLLARQAIEQAFDRLDDTRWPQARELHAREVFGPREQIMERVPCGDEKNRKHEPDRNYSRDNRGDHDAPPQGLERPRSRTSGGLIARLAR